jgi:hypothetical protein
MGLSAQTDRACFVLRWAGVRPQLDVLAIAAELADTVGNSTPRVLFDCSQISSWPFRPPTTAAIQAWYKTAPAISRVAFVHERRWNMQVAILSALFRVNKGQVRSFGRTDYNSAVAWLQEHEEIAGSRHDETGIKLRGTALEAIGFGRTI